MAVHDFTSDRLYVEATLTPGAHIELSAPQQHYLQNVLRLTAGAEILIFNGRDGEWLARLEEVRKRDSRLIVVEQVRAQTGGPDIRYLFAPLKHARLDYMVQKAVEMGVSRLTPVLTRRTVPERVKLERMRANAIEAAEQCGILRLPDIDEPIALGKVLEAWDGRPLVFCDEAAIRSDPLTVLRELAPGPVGVLIGPEGGFHQDERDMLRAKPYVVSLSLGPRIMRADTAAVAALALVNATLGDWASPS